MLLRGANLKTTPSVYWQIHSSLVPYTFLDAGYGVEGSVTMILIWNSPCSMAFCQDYTHQLAVPYHPLHIDEEQSCENWGT